MNNKTVAKAIGEVFSGAASRMEDGRALIDEEHEFAEGFNNLTDPDQIIEELDEGLAKYKDNITLADKEKLDLLVKQLDGKSGIVELLDKAIGNLRSLSGKGKLSIAMKAIEEAEYLIEVNNLDIHLKYVLEGTLEYMNVIPGAKLPRIGLGVYQNATVFILESVRDEVKRKSNEPKQ